MSVAILKKSFLNNLLNFFMGNKNIEKLFHNDENIEGNSIKMQSVEKL